MFFFIIIAIDAHVSEFHIRRQCIRSADKKKKKIHFFSFREKKETEKIMYMEGEKQTRKKQKYFVLLNFVHLVFWKTKNKSLKFFKLFYYNSDLDRWEQQSTEGSFFFFLSTELVVK